MQQIQDKAKKSCMVSFRQLHSHLKRLSQNYLHGSRTESGFKRAFATLSGQDIETFTETMFLNVEHLDKQLDKEDFQDIRSMAAFNQIRNDAHDDDADIRPIYDEEPMAEVQTTTEINIFALGRQHTEQPKFNNEGKKCVFSANHDSCVTKFLKEVNSCTKVPSNKTTNRNKPVEQISGLNKQERQILTGHRFLIQKTFVVQKKTMTHRSCLRWKSMGKIFKIVGLRWVPTGKIFASSTTKVDSEPLNGSNANITNQYECKQTLDVSAGFKEFSSDVQAMTFDHNSSELGLHNHNNEYSRSNLVPDVVPPADKTATTRQVLELLFHNHITMLRKTTII
uniref:Uncharacterized protein n=1 Tax=Tanacetum cinerariifolium TaxID=118510 RepID=A0A6L2M0Y4_TANCI|nr:hypothetical protein [Tanacetum cinerariifolium]